ncbi:MAG: hypothetical protein MJZ35_06400 [Bacteroidaceae bacterium]|nr:hypothetical protein [Bacteroidaceae bacterium]
MKTQSITSRFIMFLLFLLGATELAIGAVKGKLTPVRAGINTRTTYSLIPSTSSKNRPAAFCLSGADCEISEEAGKTIVKVKTADGNFEPVEFTDDNGEPISVDWSNILIFVGDGFFIDEYEGAKDSKGEPAEEASVANHGVCYIPGQEIPGSSQTYGTCNITMTGGSIYGIRAAGYAEADKRGYGCVYGNVDINISGGEIYELCDHGSTYGLIGNAGVLYGHYNLTMTGGTYTNAKAPSIDNVTYALNEVTTSSTIICGVTYVYDTAVLQNTDQEEPNYVKNQGSLLQDYKNKVSTTAGILTINAGTRLHTGFLINQATLHNYGTITIDGCPSCWENRQDFMNDGTMTFAKEHTMGEITPCLGSTSNTPVPYCIYCGHTTAGDLVHNFTNKYVDRGRLKETRTCSHGSIYYLSCENCGIAANSEHFTFEADDKLPHDFEIKNITPDDGFPEAGVVEIECKDCKENLSFAFNAYTRVGRTSTNPINIWAIAEPAEDGSRVEPTCQPGSEMYRLTISNGTPLAEGETDLTKMRTVIGRYLAVLPAVPDKHAWNAQGVCEHCGSAETIVGSLTDYRQIYDGNQKPLLIEEVITPIKEEATFRAKFLEEIKKALGRRTFTIYKDMDFDDKLVANDTDESQLTFDLKGHTLKVPGILTKKKLSELTVKSGRLVTQHILQEGTKCNIKVARENGASLLFDLADDGTPYIQDSEVEAEGGNGIDAQFTRNFSYANIWQAMYLPFPFTITSEMLADCDVAEVFSMDNSGSPMLVIDKLAASTTLKANTPYLIRPKATGEHVIDALNIKISKAESKGIECSADKATLNITGTYEPITGLKTKGYLFMNTAGNLSGARNDESKLKPYRWYANVTSGSASEVKVCTLGEDFFLDDEDGILLIEENEAGADLDAPLYDLSGRRVQSSKQRGIYIRGNKKVIHL